MENFKTRELNAGDYHKDHPYMKSLDKAMTHYFVTRTEDPAEHGKDYDEFKYMTGEEAVQFLQSLSDGKTKAFVKDDKDN